VKVLLVFVAWPVLLLLCWPFVLLALVLAPLLWLIALPFCVAGLVLAACFALLKALLFLPARILGYRG
jgi:hypothetical protein